MSGIAHSERSANSAHSILTNVSAWLCAFTVVIYQSWFMPYFLPFFTGRDEFAWLVFHVLYGGILIVAIAVVAARRDVLSAVLPLAIAAAMAVTPVALHPVGIVAECYLITLFLCGAAIVFMLASTPATVLRISASITALSAVTCFLDLLFANGFTNTPGRAAGLAINPNVAAAGLLLGAAASYRAVSQKWRASFLVLIGAALLATLSRSTLLAAFGTVAVPVVIRIWQQFRSDRRFQIDLNGWRRAVVVAFALLGAIGIALATNACFRLAMNESFAGVLSVGRALDEASEAVDASRDRYPPAAVPVVPSPAETSASQPAPPDSPASIEPPLAKSGISSTPPPETDKPADSAALSPQSDTPPSSAASQSTNIAKMRALGERLADEGKRNSISARALFLERGLLAYREGGFFGRGLEEAQALAPHNTFLLFAIAFGHLGWLIPIGLVGFAFCFARNAGDLGLGIALVGVMLTSHDILLTPSLFLPVALGIGGMLAERRASARKSSTATNRESWSFAFGTAAGVAAFAAGCVAILLVTPPLASGRLQSDTMVTVRGGYETLVPRSQFPGLFQFDDLPASSSSQASYLREDKIPLQRVDWSSHAWPAVRQGEYTFRRRDAVLFAATDSSDPRNNGRTYEVAVPLSVSALCFILLGTIIVWSIATVVSIRGLHRVDGL
ncbi:O-antigen ligase family protein [Mesorhizobium sp. VK23B]|uniref:O-antigen ligase family protein n=1 Tax=Mesorhizobium dulcispinae TaxID=3072316 RepID=A0ABU4XFB8_9HYPH|nr:MULTISPECIES: O-antigen ligase family protein [unclassified Mesorhizobium]MDX8466851.1 O-antigen ligase family protein [Mesorhizobium sp. VK23B]MDX8473474.1 O-antigen ligase family protein [Mesorhizobium sp. VK23A]